MLGLPSEPLPALKPLLGPRGRVGSGLGSVQLFAVALLGVAGRAQGLQVVLLVGPAEAPGGDVVDGQVLRGAAPGAFLGEFGAQLLFVSGFEGRAHGADRPRVRREPNRKGNGTGGKGTLKQELMGPSG